MKPGEATRIEPQELPRPEKGLNPTRLDKPGYVLSVPFSYCTDEANNVWMQELAPEDRRVDLDKAVRQFMNLYHYMASDSLVYLLPSPSECKLQDLVFTANIGVVLPHLPDQNTVVLSNYKSAPRVGEAELGRAFFRSMGYDVHVPPAKFEGEAELKHLHDNVYVGGYGIRSDREAYDWMERKFDMKIIKVEEVDEYLYHLDTTIFPLTPEDTIVCTEMYDPTEIKAIEAETNIIDIPADDAYSGLCNSVRLYNTILNGSHIQDMKRGTEEYDSEVSKNRKLEDIAFNLGFEVNYFNLSEFTKAGALLSCMVLHLNRKSYAFKLL